MQHSWDTMPYYDHIPDNHHYVNTIEWNELNKSYGPFTYLIVDSEGSLYYVLKDNPDFYCIWKKQENVISQLQKLGTFFDTKPLV